MEENTIIDPKSEPKEDQKEQPKTEPKFWDSKTDNSATEALNKRISDLSNPKEVYQEAINKSETTGSFNPQNEEPKKTEETINNDLKNSISNDAAMQTAKTIVRTENFLIPFVSETFFGLNSEFIKANDKEFKELQEAWFEELKNHPNFKMPSWVTLVVAHLAIYAYKIGLAIKYKKEVDKTKQLLNQFKQEKINSEQSIKQDTTEPTQAPIQPTQPPVFNQKPMHKCAMPGCDIMIPINKKYCSTSHRSKHQNQLRKEKKAL
jgi:hypothetical protein